MLFQLGYVTVDSPNDHVTFDSPGPFNVTETSEEFGGDHAVKAVVGARQPREFVGPADRKMTLSGTLFPDFFARAGYATGLDEVETLRAMAENGKPQILVRGDGVNLGWWIIEKVSQKSSKLSADGVGKVITFDIALVKSTASADPADALHLVTSLWT